MAGVWCLVIVERRDRSGVVLVAQPGCSGDEVEMGKEARYFFEIDF